MKDRSARKISKAMNSIAKQIRNGNLTYSSKHGVLLFPTNNILNKNEIDKSALYSYLRKSISKMNLSCILAFKSSNFRKRDPLRFVLYAHCAHKYDDLECKKRFRFDVVMLHNISAVMIHSNGEKECHNEKRVAQCRGKDRDDVKKELRSTTPYLYRHITVKNADYLQLDLGNLQNIRPLKTI